MNLPKDFKSKQIHIQELKKIQKTLKQEKNSYTLRSTAVSNALRNKQKGSHLDLSCFDGVLELNTAEKWVVVEPRITFANLCKFTLHYGMIPPVVPEFTSITVGGAIMGAALESSSHRYGQVSDISLEYELLLGNGETIRASKEENSDLFYGVSGSYGTLALLTSIKIQLIQAKKWVHLNFHRYDDVKQMVTDLTTHHEEDFVEGILLNKAKGVVIKGNMSDTPCKHIFRQNHAWSSWYVQHIARTDQKEMCMPLEEYLFRLDRAAFWMGRYINSFVTLSQLVLHLGIPKVKQHSINPSFLFRFLFGWALSSKKLYKLWHRVPNEVSQNLFFIHDFYTPFAKASEALDRFMEQTQIFPIWLCPIKGTRQPQFLSPHFGHDHFLNIGLYGMPQSHLSIPQLTAQLEKEIVEFGGRKMLYSFTYYDRETFSKIYQEPLYDSLRKKFYAENAFPSLYNKLTM